MKEIKYILTILSSFISYPAFAYLGPGLGGGFILATLGIILAIIVGLFAIIWFPVKRFIKKIKARK